MADTKKSAFTVAGVLTGAEILDAVQGGVNVRFTVLALALALTGATVVNGATVTTSQPLIDVTQTVNAAVAAVLIKGNMIPGGTPPTTAALVLQLQYDSVDVFKVSRTGLVTTIAGTKTAPAIGFAGVNAGIYGRGGTMLCVTNGSNEYYSFQTSVLVLSNVTELGWSSSYSDVSNGDTRLLREGAGLLALRVGTDAQEFRWYHTYTDVSNYQRGTLKTAAGYIEIAAQTAGTGADDLDVLFTPAGTGNVRFGTVAAAGAEIFSGTITIKDAGGTLRKLAVFA